MVFKLFICCVLHVLKIYLRIFSLLFFGVHAIDKKTFSAFLMTVYTALMPMFYV